MNGESTQIWGSTKTNVWSDKNMSYQKINPWILYSWQFRFKLSTWSICVSWPFRLICFVWTICMYKPFRIKISIWCVYVSRPFGFKLSDVTVCPDHLDSSICVSIILRLKSFGLKYLCLGYLDSSSPFKIFVSPGHLVSSSVKYLCILIIFFSVACIF